MIALLPTRRAVLRLLSLGALLGFVILGAGGRVAMRLIAVRSGAPATLSFDGTFNVLLAGAASGAGGALLFLIARAATSVIRPNAPRLESALFATLLFWITLRGLHPVEPFAAGLFLPLVAVYAVVFSWLARVYGALEQVRSVAGSRSVRAT